MPRAPESHMGKVGDDLARRRTDFGWAVVGALLFKVAFRALREVYEPGTDGEVLVLQLVAGFGSIAVFWWLARTALLCARALGWATWGCWCAAIACGVLQWVAWVLYFVFRRQVARRLAASQATEAQ
jgi:hypothetical protein